MKGGETDEPTSEEPTAPEPDPAAPGRITYLSGGTDTSSSTFDGGYGTGEQTGARYGEAAGGDAAAPTDDEIEPNEPRLPVGAAADDAAPPMPDPPVARPARMPAASAYRSTQERNRSVYRRANPWYRRLARGLIAITMFGALAVGVYVAARLVQDYLGRDQLPAAAPDVPTIRESSFLINATTPTIRLQGTLIADFETHSFEFVGLAGSPNANDRLTRPDADVVYARNPNATWRVVGEDDPAADLVATIDATIDVLAGSDTADVILTTQIRRDYVDLIDESEEGEGDNTRTRYDIALDLASFSSRFPVQWQSFQANAIPGVTDSSRLELSLWTDDESVLTRVQDESTGWNWERLDYSSGEFQAFQPPATQIVDPETNETATGIECRLGDVEFTTTLPTCDEAAAVGRQLVVSVGLADSPDAPAAQATFGAMCAILQGTEPSTYDDDATLELAGLLVDTGVYAGDTALLQPAG